MKNQHFTTTLLVDQTPPENTIISAIDIKYDSDGYDGIEVEEWDLEGMV